MRQTYIPLRDRTAAHRRDHRRMRVLAWAAWLFVSALVAGLATVSALANLAAVQS